MSGWRQWSSAVLVVGGAAMALTGCRRGEAPAPPRVTTVPSIPATASTLVLPIEARLSDVERGLNAEVPRRLWSIDRREERCVPAKRIKVLGKQVKVLPDLGCRIVGQVNRGPITLGGRGETLILRLPVRATLTARDVGGIASETATGEAIVHATVRLAMQPDWTPRAKIDISYDWTEAPGVTLLGQRITFTDKADDKLAGVVAGLERSLPRMLARLDTRKQVDALWRQGFTSIMLNQANPPVWLRVTPRQVGYSGYRVENGRLRLIATARTLTETFVGERPSDPVPTPLPPLSRAQGSPGFTFATPVLADYRQLEPVLQKALVKLNARGIVVPRLGPVDARFANVTIYATEGGRIAVGVDVDAQLKQGPVDRTKGRVWMTAIPFNRPNSETVEFRELTATTRTDRAALDLIAQLFATPAVLDTVRGALTQNFANDYTKVLTSAKQAIAAKRLGDVVLAATVDEVRHGRVIPTGAGLYLPVEASGTATISYRPR